MYTSTTFALSKDSMSLEVEFSHIARQKMKMMQTDKDHTSYPFTMIVIKTWNECSKFPCKHQHWEGLFFAHNSSQAKQKVKAILEKKKSFSPRLSLMHFQSLLPFRNNSNEQVFANSKLAITIPGKLVHSLHTFSTHMLPLSSM